MDGRERGILRAPYYFFSSETLHEISLSLSQSIYSAGCKACIEKLKASFMVMTSSLTGERRLSASDPMSNPISNKVGNSVKEFDKIFYPSHLDFTKVSQETGPRKGQGGFRWRTGRPRMW